MGLPVACSGDMTSRTEFLVLWLHVWEGTEDGASTSGAGLAGGRRSTQAKGRRAECDLAGPTGPSRALAGTPSPASPSCAHPVRPFLSCPASNSTPPCSRPSSQTLIHRFRKRQRNIYIFLIHKWLCLTLGMFSDIIATSRRTRKNSKLQVTCSTIMNEICKYPKTQELVRTEKCIYSNQRNIFGNAI